MKVTWKIEGAGDWFTTIEEDISCPPIEVATKALERELRQSSSTCEEIVFGLVLMVTHDQMGSVDETFICHVPTVLANAGFYKESEKIQNAIDKMLKH